MSMTSVSGLGVSGLASGLDTTGIVTKLMSIEAQPQARLKTQLSTATSFRTALQTLNSSVAAIATNANGAAKAGALTAFTASTTTTGVTASASAKATAGSLSFSVTQLAQAQISVTDPMTAWPDTSSPAPSITISTGSGATAASKTVTAASGSLDDVVAAINKAGTGVTATKVDLGTTDGSGAKQYRLQLRSASTGSAGAFSVAQGAAASGTALPTTTVTAAQDASLTLWPGSAAAQTVTSSTNTFSNLLTGVDVAATVTTTTPTTLTVAPDTGKAVSAAASLTAGLTALLANLASQTAVTTSTGASGSTSTKSGVFTGDLAVRQIRSNLLAAATDPVDGRSPASIGITLTKDGGVTFDQSAFSAAMAKDPAGTAAVFQTIAGRVGAAADTVSNQYTGTLTTRITSAQSQESRLTTQIGGWDSRLAAIKSNYQTQYNALETALSKLSSQASYLTSQLAGLTTKYTD